MLGGGCGLVVVYSDRWISREPAKNNNARTCSYRHVGTVAAVVLVVVLVVLVVVVAAVVVAGGGGCRSHDHTTESHRKRADGGEIKPGYLFEYSMALEQVSNNSLD